MQYKEAEIADTVYFWFAANETTGTAGDGASPLFDVRLAGAAANAAPTASGTPTLLSHADYSAGLYEIAIDTTGYSAGEYAVFCTLTISTVNPAGFCGSFRLKAAGASIHSATAAIVGDHGVVSIQDDIDAIKSKTDSLTFTVAGDVDCNVQTWKGAAAPDISDDSTIAAAVRDVAIAGAAANSVGAAIADILTDTGTTLDALIKDVPTVAEFEARTKPAADYFDPATDEVTPTAASKTGYALTAAYDAAKTAASPANVATEVADALRTDSGTELAAVPAKDAPIAIQTQFIFQKLRNLEVIDSGAGTHTIANDAGVTIATSVITDAAGVFTKNKVT